jgi:hypothetical protein
MRDTGVRQLLSDPDRARILTVYRGLKKLLPVKLTGAQQIVLNRATALTMRAERALGDPRVTHDEAVRLDHAAARARQEWARTVEAHYAAAAKQQPPTLQELIFAEAVR